MSSADEKLREILREKVASKFSERGMKYEYVDVSGAYDVSEKVLPDLVIKSSGIEIGKVYIILPSQIQMIGDILKSLRSEKGNIYLVIEKGREKDLTSLLLQYGLVGKVKFVLWEFKIYI